LLLKYAFEELQINRVEFAIDSRNLRSCAAVKKIGATEEGTLRQHMVLKDGYIRDTVVFSIIKPEWTHIKLSLENRLKNL
jgi:RimJ/RimL family protein N-acetyltransferase